ncbi:hypothetical protein RB594_004399 [Gaeumannomyces avenae]
MHQQPRYPPRVSSPASNLQTNPTRTNNPRDGLGAGPRSRASSGAAGQDGGQGGSRTPDGSPGPGPTRESVKKLDQIIQNFHVKAAVLILQSRTPTTPTAASRKGDGRKTNKWFQIETDEIDDFREELRIWKTCGGFENRPPPMIMETYLDASDLSSGQSLVVTDDNGNMWDVLEALNPDSSSEGSSSPMPRKRNTEIVLERWRIELKCLPSDDTEDFGPTLPATYKKSIVFFRSLFVSTKILPAWRLARQSLARPSTHPALQVRCRFVFGDPDPSGFDLLRQPLHDGRDAVTDYIFGDLEVPVGRFYASVSYRNDYSFRVDDSEALLSSGFMGVDDQMFKPSLPQRQASRRDSSYTADMGSLSTRRQDGKQPPEQQTYGSLSTFHGTGALGTSPLSALKAVRPAGSDTSSPVGSANASVEPEPLHSLPISGYAGSARPPFRGADGHSRRTSVSFQPFKAGSLSGSPRIQDTDVPPSPSSLARQSALGAFNAARNRNSLTAGMAASLRGGPPGSDAAGSASPRPGSRYSSSFTHKRGKSSFGGTSRAGDDDQGSSGKQSLSSSVQPGSGLLAEAAGASSGSIQADDENISEFLKILDSKRTLQSLEPTAKTREASAKRTVAQLSKFQLMRESNNSLTESMSSSIQLQRSSGSYSRTQSGPGMLNPASLSASLSPSKPLSPHTPHTPAIPSRLSENAIIDHQAQVQAQAQAQVTHRAVVGASAPSTRSGTTSAGSGRQEGATAIDIPLSPRLQQTNRRSSSVAHQNRALLEDDETPDLPFAGNRSISLGADSREPVSRLSGLGLIDRTGPGSADGPSSLQPAVEIRSSAVAPRSSVSSTEPEDKNPSAGLLPGTSASSYRLRYTGSIGRGQRRPTPPQSSRGSFTGSGFAGRYGTRGAGDNEADDEPLVFDMSELERPQGRASIDEPRGGGAPLGTSERGGYEGHHSRRW